jgi:hypothetical protein
MSEIYDKQYVSVGEATFGQTVLRSGRVPASAMTLDTAYTNNDLTVDFTGFSRQYFKIIPVHAGGGTPTIDVHIEEFLQDPGKVSDGLWGMKTGLGISTGHAPGDLFEHNSEDTMRKARLVVTPRGSVVDGGFRFEIGGRRDT